MAYVKVEFKRTFLGAPSVGKWDIYSSVYFDAPAGTPSLGVRNVMQRMFLLLPNTGTGAYCYTNQLQRGSGSTQLRLWTWTAGTLVARSSHSDNLVVNDGDLADVQMLPSQCCTAMGYRADVEGPRQRGYSRFWAGPLTIANGGLSEGDGGLRFTSAAVGFMQAYFRQCLDALETADWYLVVKSGPLATATFSPVVELLSDDVIDTMRSRRSWQNYQEREDR